MPRTRKKRSSGATYSSANKRTAREEPSEVPMSDLEFTEEYVAPQSICTAEESTSSMRSIEYDEFCQNSTLSTECAICRCELESDIVTTHVCEHHFHRECLLQSLQHSTRCPVCRISITPAPQGKCPTATMRTRVIANPLGTTPGLTTRLVQIDYEIPSGVQSSFHDHPGRRFHGTSRTAYLDTTPESRDLLRRLRYAFVHGLTFTVGTSLTTGRPHCVTWASIHHKTALGIGRNFALPDPGYIYNCNEELDQLRVPAADECHFPSWARPSSRRRS